MKKKLLSDPGRGNRLIVHKTGEISAPIRSQLSPINGLDGGPSHYHPLHKQLGWQPIRNHPRTPSHNFQNVSIMKQGRYFVFRREQLLATRCHPWSTPLASQNILKRQSWLIFSVKNEDWAGLLSLSLLKSGTSRSSLLP